MKRRKVTAKRPPSVFLMRQAPGSQQWYDGYTVTGNAIILPLRLILSRQSGSLPPDIISPFSPTFKNAFRYRLHVSFFYGISGFINIFVVAPRVLDTWLLLQKILHFFGYFS